MFNPGDLVELLYDDELVGIIGVVTLDPPVHCVHNYSKLAYRVFWLSEKKPKLEECGGEPRGGFIHAPALKLFKWYEVPS